MSETSWSREWFDLADMDLNAAKHLLSMHPVPVEIICFHCQQTVEKMLKGVLTSFDMEPPRTHDLVELCRLCGEKDDGFSQFEVSCATLTAYGVQARYPSELDLTEEDMNRALRDSENLCAFVKQLFNE